MTSDAYDFIVVGSGSAGGAVLGRLSESGRYRVLCLEAGTKGPGYVFTKPPAGTVFLVNNPKVNWRYYSEPHESFANRNIYVPRGKMLGGSSSINGTVYNRGQKLDYDTWAQMGCRGWSYDDVLPFLKKLESTTLGEDAYRGRSGPIRVTEAAKISPFYDLFIKSANAVGIPSNPDYSGAAQDGVAMAQQTVHRGMRSSTATQYLAQARRRGNVTIVTGAEASALILEGRRCVGVRYRGEDGREHEARASREVIVCCGTANSPKLLELSGIGNPEILSQIGIAPVHELPGVGENLRDHYAGILKWRFNREGISIAKMGRGLGLLREILRYGLFRTGFISQGIGTMRVFCRSRPDLENPDIMMVVAPYLIELKRGEDRKMSPIEGFFMYSHVQRTESTGSLHARSADPAEPPAIHFRFLQTETDRRVAVEAVRKAREIIAADPIAGTIAEELQPGPSIQSDEEILDFLRSTGQITHHMVGTCRMGHDPMAVVDDRLRVHGIAGLRVADASIMPTIPSGNTNVPCIMVGEKCAAMVLEDAKS
ncbi:GMC family oxidoreductase [Celeribacter indicus]|uniref:Choline dehydrogenase BetA n=1 Tax=Celeribacter indicus TaxID=1208324 RepID=A0A0B5E7Y2_9RHOB|nr:GMC family oxidoreductase N-terminal domain-containing protein [Celeribacter indicus]AJE49146.1 choline dehydrogenase BetA [Celeribacter indicus]SDX17544.1 choline dehydrogenase [Celeribacter indicus]